MNAGKKGPEKTDPGNINVLLERLLDGGDLSQAEAERLLVLLTEESTPPPAAGALLAALRAKGETAEEIRGFATAMRRLARRPVIGEGAALVDVVGTGGDGSGSFNLSTGAALLAAACGLRVVKHGNRSVSSRSGSADVLEQLGLPLPLDEQVAGRCLEQTGFTFLFAPYYHPAMKAVAPVRRALGVRTVFNVLGPLTNPAAPEFLLVGAFSPEAARLMAETLAGLPITRAFVVHGEPGWDEPTPVGRFLLLEVSDGAVIEQTRDPGDYGIPRCDPDQLRGGEAEANARALERVFDGERSAHRDALLLSASLVLELTGAADGPEAGLARAAEAIETGAAAALLGRLRSFGESASGALRKESNGAEEGR